jgi:hypothetical protein
VPNEKSAGALRPAKAKVIGKTYAIQYVKGSPLAEDDMGECDDENQLISVCDGLPLDNEQDTVLHECIHALDKQFSMGLKEQQVAKLATALLAFIKDNPKHLSYYRRRK